MGTPEFREVGERSELEAAVAAIGCPCVLKTRRLGYDGKGQFRIRQAAEVDTAWRALGGVPLILESFVPFESEVSIVAVRARDGDFRAYPLTRNWHAEGILSASLAPAPHSGVIAAAAFDHARRLGQELDYVGVFALELFVQGGKLLVNEMAPRVHNSGHWTIEGAWVSQFENHLRAVMGMPLGSTEVRGTSAMLNWIGELPARDPVLREACAYWHDYGKSPRPGRKVGHATITAADPEELRKVLRRLGPALDREAQIAPVLQALDEA